MFERLADSTTERRWARNAGDDGRPSEKKITVLRPGSSLSDCRIANSDLVVT